MASSIDTLGGGKNPPPESRRLPQLGTHSVSLEQGTQSSRRATGAGPTDYFLQELRNKISQTPPAPTEEKHTKLLRSHSVSEIVTWKTVYALPVFSDPHVFTLALEYAKGKRKFPNTDEYQDLAFLNVVERFNAVQNLVTAGYEHSNAVGRCINQETLKRINIKLGDLKVILDRLNTLIQSLLPAS